MRVHKQVQVINKLGLHARAAARLVRLCGDYESEITLHNGERSVDAKSIMGVMMLAATQGSSLELVVEGNDAETASKEIAALFQNYFDEGE